MPKGSVSLKPGKCSLRQVYRSEERATTFLAVLPHEAHVPGLVLVPAMVGVALHPAGRAREPRHLVVPDDVIVSKGRRHFLQRGREPGRGTVHRCRKPGRVVHVTGVLHADAPLVGGSPARVPAMSSHRPRPTCRRCSGPRTRCCQGAGTRPTCPSKTLGDVNDDHVYRGGPRPAFVQLRPLLPCQVAPG